MLDSLIRRVANLSASRSGRCLIYFSITLSAYLGAVLLASRATGTDWQYFNALSHVVRSSIFHYGQLPLHDPWVCGGIPLAANPQARVFSPTLLFDLLLRPPYSNLLALFVFGWFGAWGMMRLLRDEGISTSGALVGSFFFIHSSWFGLHYAEGHIAFGTMQLLPWVAWGCRWIHRPKCFAVLAGTLAIMMMDGGIYAVVFSIILSVVMLLTGQIPLAKWWRTGGSKPLPYLLCGVGAILLMLSKVVPVTSTFPSREPELDFYSIPLQHLFFMFYGVEQRLLFNSKAGAPYGFHEYGCYIGIAASILIVWASVKYSLLKRYWPVSLAAAIFLWMGIGWGAGFNPWHIVHKIPLLNHAHVQSRILLLFILFIAILLGRAYDQRLQTFGWSKGTKWLLGILLFEGLFFSNQPIIAQFKKQTPHDWQFSRLITHDRLLVTNPRSQKPGHYSLINHGAKNCYEPAVHSLPLESVKSYDESDYRGETYLLDGAGTSILAGYTPGLIRLTVDTETSSTIAVNTRNWRGWQITTGDAILLEDQPIVTLQVPQGRQTISVRYQPDWVKKVAVLLPLGSLMFLLGLGTLPKS